MSVTLSAERDRIQRQVEELEQSLSVSHVELELLTSETDDESGSDDTEEEAGQSAAGLLAQREKIQKEIQNLENVLGPHSPTCVSDDDGSSSSSEESELGLSLSVDSCLQMNLVYQQVVQETLGQLETLLTQNQRQQKEVVSQLSGPIRESPREQHPPSSCQQPINMFLGRFLKPYFKDKLTGLGPPANQETKEKTSRMTGCPDNHKLKIRRWESWQKTLLIHSVSRDHLRRLIQPKLSKVDYLSQKLLSASETDRELLREQIDSLEREIDLLRLKKEEELIGDRHEEHDWQRISNIDFEGTREAEDVRSFWRNFLHPSINKSEWSQEEVQQLKEVGRRHGERHWESIAEELETGRTAFLCLQTFQRFASDSLRRHSWTPDEDALLQELVEKMRIGNFIPYTQMSYFMEGRDPAQLIYRWNQVLDPSLKKGPWTQQEDQLLLQAVSVHGEKNWWRIRSEVPGRSDSACRDRYYDCLRAGTKKGAFDEQERELLVKLVEKHGVGRWARIAAEIPHRFDAQCLREWRKLNRSAAPAQKNKKLKTPPVRRRAETRKKASPARKRIRRRLRRLKEEEEEQEEQEEQEEEEEEEEEEELLMLEYMDSDEEKKKKKKKKKKGEVVTLTEKEKEEEYHLPPIEEWTPAGGAQSQSFLSFHPVEFPPSGDANREKPVRLTIQGEFGRSVVNGPPPRELKWEERRRSGTMMMVSRDQLHAHLRHQVQKFNPSRQRTSAGKLLRQVTSTGLSYELQAAVTPWIGNLLISAKTKLTGADALRERGEKVRLTSTPVFLLLLQTMRVDAAGCKEMIEQRRNGVAVPPADPPPVQTKAAQTFARAMQQRRLKEEQDLDLQHNLILGQLQLLFKQQPQQLMLLQPPPPSTTPQNLPRVLLQMPPQMSPLSFPQTVFIPVMQPREASIQFLTPPPSTTPPPAPCRPSSAPQTLPVPPNTTHLQRAGPRPLSPNQHVSISSTPATQHTCPPTSSIPAKPCPAPGPAPDPAASPSNSIPNPLKGQMVTADQQASGSSLNGGGLERAGASVSLIQEGRRVRTPSVKARALLEASAAQAEEKKKAASSPRRKTRDRRRGQTAIPVPPLQACPGPGHLPPPQSLSSLRQSASPVLSDRTVSSTHNVTLAPPPSIPTNQHTDTSTSGLPGSFHDHDYTCQHLSNLSPAPKPDPAHNNPPKAPPRGKKRLRGEGEEQPSVTSSNDEPCVGGSGVTQEGKRMRKPSERVRAVQEATQAKAESKKKKRTSPRQRRRRTSRPNQKEVVQTPPPAQLTSMRLHPGQTMWVMTSSGLVQLAEAPPSGVQLALVQRSQVPSPPGATLPQANSVLHPLAPPPPSLNKPRLLHAPPNTTSCPSQPSPKLFLPQNGTGRAPPPLRKEVLQFDPSLMFLESRVAVCDWLSGWGGVTVPGVGRALPYLPPFVSSLSALSALLHAKKSLTALSLQVLHQGSEPQHPQTKPSSSIRRTTGLPDLPDSTSDLTPAPSVSSNPPQEEVEEVEEVVAVRQLVKERFSGNPAYQLLKVRFLSCFTLPAFLATVQPITDNTTVSQQDSEEEEDEEEDEEDEEEEGGEEGPKKERSRRVQSSLLCEESAASASHFSGLTNTLAPDQVQRRQ